MSPYVLRFEAGWIGEDPGGQGATWSREGSGCFRRPPGRSVEMVEKTEGGENAGRSGWQVWRQQQNEAGAGSGQAEKRRLEGGRWPSVSGLP